jgi:uncharacterized membrane-anchored protein
LQVWNICRVSIAALETGVLVRVARARAGHSTNALTAAAVAAGTPPAEGIARMAALLAVWTGRRLFITAGAAASITTVGEATRYAKAA